MTLRGHGTSITLEPAFWDALKEISTQTDKTIGQIVEHIDAAQPENLSGAVRVYILRHFMKSGG